MITEGILENIDYNSNSCVVRIPLFENVGSSGEAVCVGRIMVQPGYFNNYAIGDIVWVGFIDNKLGKPLVIGKIYQGPEIENSTSGGHLNIKNLNVNNGAVLPLNTKLADSDTDFNTILALIEQIKQLKSELNKQSADIRELQIQIANINVDK